MLVLSRDVGESIVITLPAVLPAGGEIVLSVERVAGGTVRLGFTAPREVTIHRAEVAQKMALDALRRVV